MLTLNRLERRERGPRQRVAGNKALPDYVVDEIVERTDGVPLFVEELTKAVLEAGDEANQDDRSRPPPALASRPRSRLADGAARRLGSATKEIAQIGAAIGREFSYELLSAVARRNDD